MPAGGTWAVHSAVLNFSCYKAHATHLPRAVQYLPYALHVQCVPRGLYGNEGGPMRSVSARQHGNEQEPRSVGRLAGRSRECC